MIVVGVRHSCILIRMVVLVPYCTQWEIMMQQNPNNIPGWLVGWSPYTWLGVVFVCVNLIHYRISSSYYYNRRRIVYYYYYRQYYTSPTTEEVCSTIDTTSSMMTTNLRRVLLLLLTSIQHILVTCTTIDKSCTTIDDEFTTSTTVL